MSTEDNKAIARRYWEELWNTGNLASLDEILAPDYAAHDAAGRVVRGTETIKRTIPTWRAAFPDLHFALEDVFAEGDKVVVRWRAQGTHKGNIEVLGHIPHTPPTGKHVSFAGMDIYHVRGGKIVEGWRSMDRLGLLQQLGVVPTAG